MAEDKTTPEQAAPATKERRQPHGPGPLLFFGLVCLVVAAWCFYDLFLGSAGSSWEKSGSTLTIWVNRMLLALGGVGAIYFFILAAKRFRKPPAGNTAGEA